MLCQPNHRPPHGGHGGPQSMRSFTDWTKGPSCGESLREVSRRAGPELSPRAQNTQDPVPVGTGGDGGRGAELGAERREAGELARRSTLPLSHWTHHLVSLGPGRVGGEARDLDQTGGMAFRPNSRRAASQPQIHAGACSCISHTRPLGNIPLNRRSLGLRERKTQIVEKPHGSGLEHTEAPAPGSRDTTHLPHGPPPPQRDPRGMRGVRWAPPWDTRGRERTSCSENSSYLPPEASRTILLEIWGRLEKVSVDI